MDKTRVILVGGFLGAGKTTLVAKASQLLAARGMRVGLITNDQAADLVDTAILKEAAGSVEEVAGGCFCCRFDELMSAMNRLVGAGMPQVLIGEPVGSCTDLSATVLQPMKQFYRDRFEVAPFSVLVDVKQVRTLERLRASIGGAEAARFPENVMYIYEKQLEEADLIVLNKADLLSSEQLAEVEDTLKREFTQAPVLTVSAREGTGVDTWLDLILQGGEAGRTITDVDYDEYAAGEAALGWLNASLRVRSPSPIDAAAFCRRLIAAMQAQLAADQAEVAHLKLHLSGGDTTVVANLTESSGEPFVRAGANAPLNDGLLLVNIRANIDPQHLRAVTEDAIRQLAGSWATIDVESIRSFAPSRPEPVHRFAAVVR